MLCESQRPQDCAQAEDGGGRFMALMLNIVFQGTSSTSHSGLSLMAKDDVVCKLIMACSGGREID
jgi:hypothetical protein